MEIDLKGPVWGKNSLIVLFIASGILIGLLPIFEAKSQKTENLTEILISEHLVMIEGNSLLAKADHLNIDSQITKKINVVITAYSSTPEQTDDEPYITAAGTWVREGIIANNLLPFGTKIRIPELYGDKVFVVEDRMHRRKGYYHVDIWFASYGEAKNFGAKRTYIEVLEN